MSDCVGFMPKTQNLQLQDARCGGCWSDQGDGDEWELAGAEASELQPKGLHSEQALRLTNSY